MARTVAMVTCDGVVVNWRQVNDGMAWCFTKYLTQPATCLPLEREARAARRGCGARIHRCRLGNLELLGLGLSRWGRDSQTNYAERSCIAVAL